MNKKSVVTYFTLLSCFLFLFIVACGTDPNVDAGSIPNLSTTATAKPPQFTLYNGDGFSISRPSEWKVEKEGVATSFTSQEAVAENVRAPKLAVAQSDQLGAPISFEFGTSAPQNCKLSTSVPTTVTISSITWKQAESICTSAASSTDTTVLRTLTATHPVSNVEFVVYYLADQKTFDHNTQLYFQPMLESFRFI